jgi:hypothetical protein
MALRTGHWARRTARIRLIGGLGCSEKGLTCGACVMAGSPARSILAPGLSRSAAAACWPRRARHVHDALVYRCTAGSIVRRHSPRIQSSSSSSSSSPPVSGRQGQAASHGWPLRTHATWRPLHAWLHYGEYRPALNHSTDQTRTHPDPYRTPRSGGSHAVEDWRARLAPLPTK